MSASFLDFTPGSLNVSKLAALLSKKRRFVRFRRECRALTRSSLPFKIQNPSNTTGMRGTRAALLKWFRIVCRLSRGTRENGQISGLPVVPLMPYQQSMKNLRVVLVDLKGQALAPSGSLREVGLNE